MDNSVDTSHIAALDIGGTKIAAMVAGPEGPLARVTQATAKTGTPRALPEQALSLIELACEKAKIDPASLTTVGVASCGPFVYEQDLLCLSAPNICGGGRSAADLPNDWEGIPLEQVLRERFNRVVIENDCVAALAAERAFGAVMGQRDCVYVTWSTGIGFGLCVDGHILRGKHGNAGHAGHMMISEREDALCGCGNRGDVEGLISGRNIANRLSMNAADVFNQARDGDPKAKAATLAAARWLGRALYNVAVTLDTRTFVIGGSIWVHHGNWLEPFVQQEIDARLPALTRGVSILRAALGGVVADIGAMTLVIPDEWIANWRNTAPWQRLGAA